MTNPVNNSPTHSTGPTSPIAHSPPNARGSFAARRASVLSIQIDSPVQAPRFAQLSLEDEGAQEVPNTAPIILVSSSHLIAPKVPEGSPMFQTLKALSSPSGKELKIHKFSKTSVSANGVYLVSSPSSIERSMTPTPRSESNSSSLSGSNTGRSMSSSSTPKPDSTSLNLPDVPEVIEEVEEDEFIFKPASEGIDFRNAGAKPKHGIESADQPMMECVARILSPSEIVPPTALLTINFDLAAQEVVEKKEDESDEEIDIPEFQSDTYTSSAFPEPSALKTGSAQKFIKDTQSFKEMTSAEQAERVQKVLVDEVHDLSILDIRSYNTDRHLGNVLIDKKDHIHAIDHGCIATRDFNDPALFCWMEWPQAHLPYSKEKKEYILGLDWEKTKQDILDSFPNFPKESLATLRFSHFLLQEGVKRDLTPFQIGSLMIGQRQVVGITYPGLVQQLYEKKIKKGFDQLLTSMLDSLFTNGKSQSISMKALSSIYDTCQSEAMKIVFEEDFKEEVVSLLDSLSENMKRLETKASTENTSLSATIYNFLKEKI